MLAVLALAGALAALPAVAVVAAEPLPEYDVKAAFLYNFALFTDWPGAAPQGVVFCVLGQDPFGAALDAFQSKPLRGAQVEVRRLPEAAGVRGCHVLFIGARDAQGVARGLQAAKGLPVLTVADAPGALDAGVMIVMALDERRVVFEVNREAAAGAGLSLSSKLLRLARAVR